MDNPAQFCYTEPMKITQEDDNMEQQKRHSGIDCMRIVCMLLIVLYHLQGHGGLIASEQISPANRLFIVSLQSICQLAVDGFALISGYIGYAHRQRYASLVSLWLRVLFYSAGITAAFWLITPAAVSYADIRSAFFPLLTGQYWYFTAYAGCFVLAPLARAAIAQLSRRDAVACLTGVVLVFSVLPYLMRNDPFLTSSGNHALWLLIVYALGAYVRKYDPFAQRSTRSLALLFAAACAVQAASGFILPAVSRLLTGKAVTRWYLVCNDSPTTLVLALLALALFSRLRLSRSTRVFRLLVSCSFSVYLLHDHPLVRRHVVAPLGARLAALPSFLLIPSLLASACGIYLLCAGVDALRGKLFDVLRIDALLLRAEDRLTRRSCSP